MWSIPHFGRPREAATNIPCKVCAKPLTAHRGCREVTLVCPACGARFRTEDFPDAMDDLFEFLADVPADRI